MSTVDTADDLARKVQELERELAEARQQQAGTSDILRVIGGSTTDITRVFDAIARSAARLCEAFDVIVLRVDGDVLRLVAEGLTDVQVAEKLVLSPRTISSHLRSIYNKLGVNSRAAATRFAFENHLV